MEARKTIPFVFVALVLIVALTFSYNHVRKYDTLISKDENSILINGIELRPVVTEDAKPPAMPESGPDTIVVNGIKLHATNSIPWGKAPPVQVAQHPKPVIRFGEGLPKPFKHYAVSPQVVVNGLELEPIEMKDEGEENLSSLHSKPATGPAHPNSDKTAVPKKAMPKTARSIVAKTSPVIAKTSSAVVAGVQFKRVETISTERLSPKLAP